MLRPAVNRPLNILLGLAYTAIVIFFMPGGRMFHQAMAVEIALQLLVVWYAWRWPCNAPAS